MNSAKVKEHSALAEQHLASADEATVEDKTLIAAANLDYQSAIAHALLALFWTQEFAQ